ncbi:LysR family transcriptional regulator [Aliivibrio wodanis]|uniref:LysR family transcriptional regulator n=1 Tax=Aliivibrio wodanis TaxID=80852 RepID=UPI00406CEACD
MDAKIFKTFLEVAKVKHFGRAAENLYLTQAAVSARIKQLETYFDTLLFTRDRNNIRLTSSGERLVGYAEIVVSTLQQAKLELSMNSKKSFQITIAGTPSVWDVFLQNGLVTITDSFTNYGFIAEVKNREQLNRHLLERTLDMAFSFDLIKRDEFFCNVISQVSLVFVSTKNIQLSDVFNDKYVYIDWGTRFTSEHLERHPDIPVPYLRTSTARIALDFILEKGGSAYLPLIMVEKFIKSGELYRVKDVDDWSRSIYLIYCKNSSALDAIQQIEELLKK